MRISDWSSDVCSSDLWLRLKAMAGAQWKEANEYHRLALIVDEPDGYHPASQPAPTPPVDARPKNIAVTDVDRLKADPYSLYARKMLGLSSLDPVVGTAHNRRVRTESIRACHDRLSPD